MATSRRATAQSEATSTRGQTQEEDVLDAEEEAEAQELFELATMVSTIDRIVVSLKRLNETISIGGALYESQKDLQDALTGRQRLEEQQSKRGRPSKEAEETGISSGEEYDDDAGDEEEEEY